MAIKIRARRPPTSTISLLQNRSPRIRHFARGVTFQVKQDPADIPRCFPFGLAACVRLRVPITRRWVLLGVRRVYDENAASCRE